MGQASDPFEYNVAGGGQEVRAPIKDRPETLAAIFPVCKNKKRDASAVGQRVSCFSFAPPIAQHTSVMCPWGSAH